MAIYRALPPTYNCEYLRASTAFWLNANTGIKAVRTNIIICFFIIDYILVLIQVYLLPPRLPPPELPRLPPLEDPLLLDGLE
jgi:hypothetical protein